jgi:hypothetical protein
VTLNLELSETSLGEFLIVLAALPGAPAQNIGILLLDPDANRLYSRFRRDTEEYAGGEADWFELLADDVIAQSRELGAREYLAWMETTLSHVLRISERESVQVRDYEKAADRLYREHVRPRVLPFRTHLPQYSLAAAAGRFGDQMEVQPEGWIEVHSNIPLTEDMFVTHVVGRSMEPMIPSHSLCAFRTFRTPLAGPYSGRVVLLEHYGEEGGDRYAISRYHPSSNPDSDKKGDKAWLHERITVEPANVQYASWDIASAEKIRVLGEFLFVVQEGVGPTSAPSPAAGAGTGWSAR